MITHPTDAKGIVGYAAVAHTCHFDQVTITVSTQRSYQNDSGTRGLLTRYFGYEVRPRKPTLTIRVVLVLRGDDLRAAVLFAGNGSRLPPLS